MGSRVDPHSRQAEICFWAQALRAVTRFVFVTEDRDVYSARHRSELGRSCEEATLPRRLLETFTDGVYLVRRYPTTSSPDLLRDIDAFETRGKNTTPPVYHAEGLEGHTRYCSRVRPLDDLVKHLQEWSAAETGAHVAVPRPGLPEGMTSPNPHSRERSRS